VPSHAGQGAATDTGCSRELGSCSPLPADFRFASLLEVSRFGPDARIAAIGGRSVLVTAPGSAARIVLVDGPAMPAHAGDPYSVYTLPEPELEVLDVANDTDQSNRSASVFALACRVGRTYCSLWQSRAGDAVLSEISGTELDTAPRGIVFDAGSGQSDAICVFGKGMKCSASGWQETIPYQDGVDILDVAISNDFAIAVGAQGHYWTRTYDASLGGLQWQAQPPMSIEFSHASAGWSGAAAIGSMGELITLDGKSISSCLWGGDLAAVQPSSNPKLYTVVTKQGRVLKPSSNAAGHCLSESLNIEAIFASSTVVCAASDNLWIATPTAVFGEHSCVEVP
jgi:hypothetical protein